MAKDTRYETLLRTTRGLAVVSFELMQELRRERSLLQYAQAIASLS